MSNPREMDAELVKLVKGVSTALDQGISTNDISAHLVEIGMPKTEADQFVKNVSSARAQANNNEPSHLKILLLEGWHLIASAVALWCVAVTISYLLGLFEPILGLIGLGGLGAALAKFGEMAAGAGLGALASVATTESRSIGVLLGCWIGVVAYYAWLWYMIS